MLHARHPVVPPAHAERFAEPIDFDNVDPATRNVRDRAHTAGQAGIIAGENLRIAQHQDTLHYATSEEGDTCPLSDNFKKEIYRVKAVHPNGAIQLQGICGVTLMNNVCNVAPCHLLGINPTIDHTLARPHQSLACEVCSFMNEEDKMLLCDGCGTGWHTMYIQPPLTSIPKDKWPCSRCVKDGVSIADLRIRRTQQEPVPGPIRIGRTVPLFAEVEARRKEQEHCAFDGRKVAVKEKRGRREITKLGTVKYKGPILA